jgi:hypothetical protein
MKFIDIMLLEYIEQLKQNKGLNNFTKDERERMAEIVAFLGGEARDLVGIRTQEDAIYQFKITLKGVRPPIWRRFTVRSDITFNQLHTIIQIIMGWQGYHLYSFSQKGLNIMVSDGEDFFSFGETLDSRTTQVGSIIATEKEKWLYTYDFGDDWEHELLLEKILPFNGEVTIPYCVKGKRACPPEDCGGIYMYSEIQEDIKNGAPLEDHLEEWLGDFDPEEFDLEVVNNDLEHFAKRELQKQTK